MKNFSSYVTTSGLVLFVFFAAMAQQRPGSTTKQLVPAGTPANAPKTKTSTAKTFSGQPVSGNGSQLHPVSTSTLKPASKSTTAPLATTKKVAPAVIPVNSPTTKNTKAKTPSGGPTSPNGKQLKPVTKKP